MGKKKLVCVCVMAPGAKSGGRRRVRRGFVFGALTPPPPPPPPFRTCGLRGVGRR